MAKKVSYTVSASRMTLAQLTLRAEQLARQLEELNHKRCMIETEGRAIAAELDHRLTAHVIVTDAFCTRCHASVTSTDYEAGHCTQCGEPLKAGALARRREAETR